MQFSDSESSSADEEQPLEIEPEPMSAEENETEAEAEAPHDAEVCSEEAQVESAPSKVAAVEKVPDESTVQSEGSTTDENEDLRELLLRHEVVEVPLLPDAAIIPPGANNLSVIPEERTFEQSMAMEQTRLSVPEEAEEASEEEEAVAPNEPEPAEKTTSIPSAEVSVERPSSSAVMDEDDFPWGGSEPEQEDVAEPVVPKKRGRPRKSIRLSQVPLPFTSRRSTWDAAGGSQEGDLSSCSSRSPEPTQTAVEAGSSPRAESRQGRNTAANTPTPAAQSGAPRRSSRLAAYASEDETLTAPTVLRTPPKSTSKRRSRDPRGETPVLPSADVSPTESNYSGRSSAPGTPMRRSMRLALREKTPEPTAAAIGEALMVGLGRVRRHSAGPSVGETATMTPRRRSGRLSANASRDNSPNSITSEPPPRTETTPSRRTAKGGRGSRNTSKSATINLFPVEEEELEEKASKKAEEDSSSQDEEDDAATAKKTGKTRGSSRPPSAVPSSPSSTRYNLRRTRRTSDLGIISEEDAALQQQQQQQQADTAVTTLKRRRQEPAEDKSEQQAGPSAGSQEEATEESVETKKTVRSKRRKKQEETESSGKLHTDVVFNNLTYNKFYL